MLKNVSRSRPKDPRRTAGLTGTRPLTYDRHGDLIGFSGGEDLDPAELIGDRWLGDRWLARSFGGRR